MDKERIRNRFAKFITSKWTKWVGIFILAILLFLLLFDQILMPLFVRLGQESTIPDLLGLSPEEANAILKDKGLELRVIGEEYDLKRVAGTIIYQMPEPESKVKKGRKIKVVLSKGGEKATVPQ
ncbi:MAG: PASTA domain-containing protein, partial [candidate division Zixibacteria bacterium]|nr:PASTA domain-containing protein [candidate division Zixibacteria bacterium]